MNFLCVLLLNAYTRLEGPCSVSHGDFSFFSVVGCKGLEILEIFAWLIMPYYIHNTSNKLYAIADIELR